MSSVSPTDKDLYNDTYRYHLQPILISCPCPFKLTIHELIYKIKFSFSEEHTFSTFRNVIKAVPVWRKQVHFTIDYNFSVQSFPFTQLYRTLLGNTVHCCIVPKLKGQSHQIVDFRFFHQPASSGPSRNILDKDFVFFQTFAEISKFENDSRFCDVIMGHQETSTRDDRFLPIFMLHSGDIPIVQVILGS